MHFQDELEKLTAHERRILACFSLYWLLLTNSDASILLTALGILTPDGKVYSPQRVAPLRRLFLELGLVEESNGAVGRGFQIANDALSEYLVRELQHDPSFEDFVLTISHKFPRVDRDTWLPDSTVEARHLRDFRLAIYIQANEEISSLMTDIVKLNLQDATLRIIINAFLNPFQDKLMSGLEKGFQKSFIPILVNELIEKCQPTEEVWKFVNENDLQGDYLIKEAFARELIFRGEIDRAAMQLDSPTTFETAFSLGIVLFLKQDYQESVKSFENGIKHWKKVVNKKKGYPGDWNLFIYGLALLKVSELKFFKFVDEFSVYSLKNYQQNDHVKALNAIYGYLRNNEEFLRSQYEQIAGRDFTSQLILMITASIIKSATMPSNARDFSEICLSLGYDWARYEAVNLLRNRSKTGADAQYRELKDKLAFEPAGNILPRIEGWERILNMIELIGLEVAPNEINNASAQESRIAWQIDFERYGIQPVEQKFGKNGWTDGRNVAMKRLKNLEVENLTDQDAVVVSKSLKTVSSYYYGGVEYEIAWEKAIPELIGHPFLFLRKNPTVNIQLIDAEPNLIVRAIGEELEISFDIEINEIGFKVQKETESRFKVVRISKQHTEIADLLGNGALRIPKEGRQKLVNAIQPLTRKISIQSDLEEHFEDMPTVKAETRIHALITPVAEGFHLEFFVKPFGSTPPYFKPGKGTESVLADLDGVRTRARRNLVDERNSLIEVEAMCPFLASFESPNYEWDFVDTQECLIAMSELEIPRKEGKLVVEWTKGQRLRLMGSINFDDVSLTITGKNNWFEIEGKVQVNEELVLSMRELSKLLTNQNSNFVELSDGQFVAITEKLRKHLQSLSSASDEGRLHSLRSGILEDLAAELANFNADNAWREHIEKLREAQSFVPVLPKTFEAELRPYQLEGFEWLSRLAEWGVGACLADDMGLGKTIMALALLVERAEKGAALVVAPVSVTRNWVKEAQRFAPTLNFRIFGEGNRKEQIESLGKYDVLVTSYSLLQIEAEDFINKKFATIVLDEAQAIKNRTTKRSKTVMDLQGDFRLITTGTPIENHLGELWNLFNFINPGLLGSHQFFNERFAVPIEKNRDDNARKTLQRLIKPFVLRRRKNQVLDDLPEKTEIVLNVELSESERAFYEATRREALEKIDAEGGDTKDKRFRILAELTRLRLACCHPKLVNENMPLGSSKLDLFGETLDELLENRHKALVFSQFVKHLAIIEEYLKMKGIPYHYLDGSTPAAVRQERIDEFQRGSGDVFLISLKAGGTGLNLTAADYVIHLDPWWNPAVEDQASDRAHRIGQQRPVTVYRLVTEDTVEEKILKLHETKRDLADSLLEGTDSSGRLSAEELMDLIREN